jgi:hypothetical protein
MNLRLHYVITDITSPLINASMVLFVAVLGGTPHARCGGILATPPEPARSASAATHRRSRPDAKLA